VCDSDCRCSGCRSCGGCENCGDTKVGGGEEEKTVGVILSAFCLKKINK